MARCFYKLLDSAQWDEAEERVNVRREELTKLAKTFARKGL